METKPIEGRCLCGAVTFSIAEPKESAHCHCSYCRRAHGAAFVTWVVAPLASFRVRGEVRWYESSAKSQRGFCVGCGSTMFFKSVLCAGEIHVTRANLTSEVAIAPMCHCFSEAKVSWVSIDDELPRLTADSAELAKYKSITPL